MDPNQIAEHFSDIYVKLFNNVQDDKNLDLVEKKIEDKVFESSYSSLWRVNEDTVRSAVNSLKSDKKDSVFSVTSDMYKSSPSAFIKHLTNILRGSLIHSAIPHAVLLCSLMPLVKDNLGDITKSSNYRAIAGGCLILKVLDLLILEIESEKLSTDCLQFAYKPNSGTASCSWMVTLVVDYFTRNGPALDMSKAFDMVKWSELFSSLIERGINPIFLR